LEAAKVINHRLCLLPDWMNGNIGGVEQQEENLF